MKMVGLARLGRNAELRYLQDGKAVATLSLAFNYGRKGEDGRRPSEWIKASLWGQRAESLIDFLVQGTSVSVVLGDPHIQTYQKQDGSTGYSLEAMVDDIELAGSRPQGGQQGGQQSGQQQAPRQAGGQQGQAPRQAQGNVPRQAAPQQRQQQAPRQHQPAGSGFDDMDDDIPF